MIFWIASYPKSGNTWIRSFISTYYFSKNDNFEFNYLANIKQFPHEKFFKKNLKDISEAIKSWDEAQNNILDQKKIIFLKTHSALMKINNHNFTSDKYSIAGIYIVRDPRNIITSLSNHYDLNFKDSLDFMTNSNKYLINKNSKNLNFGNFQFISSWSNNYMSWKKYKKFKILFIKYEDLEKNPIDIFTEVVQFTNNILNKKDNIEKNRIKRIINSINFDTLKKKEKEKGFPEEVYDKNNKKINFFYLGKKNKWNEVLSKEKIKILNEKFDKDLKALKY